MVRSVRLGGSTPGGDGAYLHVGVPVRVVRVTVDSPLERRQQGLRLDEEREEVAVDGADGGPAVLELVAAVGELLDVPLHQENRGGRVSDGDEGEGGMASAPGEARCPRGACRRPSEGGSCLR